MFVQTAALAIIFLYDDSNVRVERFRLAVAAYSLLTVIYFVIFFLLNQKMSKLDIDTINADKISIKFQFGIFMFAFATRDLYYITQILIKFRFNYFTAMFESLFLIVWVIVPITYMLIMHNRTFSAVL